MQDKANSQELKERIFHLELINKLLEAENRELKSVISEIKQMPKKPAKISFKNRIKNTLIYRGMRKIKRMIVGMCHE